MIFRHPVFQAFNNVIPNGLIIGGQKVAATLPDKIAVVIQFEIDSLVDVFQWMPIIIGNVIYHHIQNDSDPFPVKRFHHVFHFRNSTAVFSIPGIKFICPIGGIVTFRRHVKCGHITPVISRVRVPIVVHAIRILFIRDLKIGKIPKGQKLDRIYTQRFQMFDPALLIFFNEPEI